MNALTKITPEMFPDLRDGVLRELDPNMSEVRWRRIFVDHADADRGAGYALTDGGRIVGILGTVYSERSLCGQSARFCNVHSWYVQPEFRGKSLLLMRPVLRMRDHTITDFSPTRSVVAISRRLGFERLDSSAWMLLPMMCRKPQPSVSVEQLTTLDEPSASILSDADRKICHDHQGIECGHLLLSEGNEYCYVVFSRIKYRWFAHCFVHYISNTRQFVRHHHAFRLRLMQLTGTRCVLIESRLLAGARLPNSVRCPTLEKLYRPADAVPAKVDSLYSDVALLQLSTLPSMRRLIAMPVIRAAMSMRRWSQRMVPAMFHAVPEVCSDLGVMELL